MYSTNKSHGLDPTQPEPSRAEPSNTFPGGHHFLPHSTYQPPCVCCVLLPYYRPPLSFCYPFSIPFSLLLLLPTSLSHSISISISTSNQLMTSYLLTLHWNSHWHLWAGHTRSIAVAHRVFNKKQRNAQAKKRKGKAKEKPTTKRLSEFPSNFLPKSFHCISFHCIQSF